MQSLRACLQAAEKSGMVEFSLGGHTAERPGSVYQGTDDDKLLATNACHHIQFIYCQKASCCCFISGVTLGLRFNIEPKEDSPMCWKPSNIQLKSLKHGNCASYVPADRIGASPALDLVSWLNSCGFHSWSAF